MITVLLYTSVAHHDKKKKPSICSFSWQIGKTNNISREMSPFLFNFIFLNNKEIYRKQKIYFQINIFQKIIFKKKVVPAITHICTGGQQCKYQLLGSGGNISYYLQGVIFWLLFFKNMKECRYHYQILHTHTSWHYEVTVKFATRNMK